MSDLCAELKAIYDRHKLKGEVDPKALETAVSWAENFYWWTRDGEPDHAADTAVAMLQLGKILAQALELSDPVPENSLRNFSRLVEAIAELDTETFGPAVPRFEQEPGSGVDLPTGEWHARADVIREKLFEWLRFSELVQCAAASVPAPPPQKRGPAKSKRDLYAAVGALYDYWTKVLGQKFAVTFSKDEIEGEERQRRKRKEVGKGRFVGVHTAPLKPGSAAAKFVVAAMKQIDSKRTAEEIRSVMGDLRSSLGQGR